MKKFALILITASFFTITTQVHAAIETPPFTGLFAEAIAPRGWFPARGCCTIGGPRGNNSLASAAQFELVSPAQISALIFDIDIRNQRGLNPTDPEYVYDYIFGVSIVGDVLRTVGSNVVEHHLPAGHSFFNPAREISIQTNGDGTSHKDYFLNYGSTQLDPGLHWLVFTRGSSSAFANITNIRFETAATTVPEPSTLLLVSPLLFLGFMRRRNKS